MVEEQMAQRIELSKIQGSATWKLQRGMQVALLHDAQYFFGSGVVVKVTSRAPLIARVLVTKTHSDRVGALSIPFLEGNLQTIGQCLGKEVLWEAIFLRPYVELPDDADSSIGGLLTVQEDEKPIQGFMSLAVRMQVALIVDEGVTGFGEIHECSPKGP